MSVTQLDRRKGVSGYPVVRASRQLRSLQRRVARVTVLAMLGPLCWSRFSTREALGSLCGGLTSSIGLILVSSVVSGRAGHAGPSLSMITAPRVYFAIFPLENPVIVGIPLVFLLGWLGWVTSSQQVDLGCFARIKVRARAGSEAVKAARR